MISAPRPIARGCTAKLKPGEYKRIPKGAATPVGFYVACPLCGVVNPLPSAALQTGGVTFEERLLLDEIVLYSLSRVGCLRCKRGFGIADGRYCELP